MNSYSCTLSPEAATRAETHLRTGPYELREVAHARIAGRREGLNLVLYKSRKLVIQGKKTREWIEFELEPNILQQLVAEKAPPSAEMQETHIGIDESGKGDFFGPMVITAFRYTPTQLPWLKQLGVQDSKNIKSDSKIADIANKIRQKAPESIQEIALKPEVYNRGILKMNSVNRLLAWGHASVLEGLLKRFPDTQLAIADQFGPEHQIQNALQEHGRNIKLIQRHKAESDPAVAAASILARDRFVMIMEELSQLAGRPLPKGATHVRAPAEELVKAQGPEILKKLAKTHFRTTRQVLSACGYDPALLGTPEPKANPWKKRR